MRKVFAVLAIAALAAACSDEPTAPAADEPQFASYGDPHGAWVQRYVAEDMFCGFWDADGLVIPPVPCNIVSTPNPHGSFTVRIYSRGPIPNATGRAVRFGPDHYPTQLEEWYLATFGITPTADGLMPLCDWNVREYPDAWKVFPFPPEAMPLIICSTNWQYTISAAGKGTLIWTADPGHSWRPFAN